MQASSRALQGAKLIGTMHTQVNLKSGKVFLKANNGRITAVYYPSNRKAPSDITQVIAKSF